MRVQRVIKIVLPDAEVYNAGMSDFNLTHHFLIAMPAMQEGFFAGTLTYVCEHNENGALGIVVNRPISLTLGELFEPGQHSAASAQAGEDAGAFWRAGADRARLRVA